MAIFSFITRNVVNIRAAVVVPVAVVPAAVVAVVVAVGYPRKYTLGKLGMRYNFVLVSLLLLLLLPLLLLL